MRVVNIEKKLLFAPPAFIKHFSFGHKESIGDTLWVRVIQDIDLCEQQFAPDQQLRVDKERIHNCKKGWVYHMLDAIIETAPRWRLPQAIGPLLLSVVIDDIEGASLLFKKAVENFPEDWAILFRAGYHFLYETDDVFFAARMFDEAGKHGAPMWVHSLAAKLYSEKGRNHVARVVLLDALKRTPPGKIRDKIAKRLAQVEEALIKADAASKKKTKTE